MTRPASSPHEDAVDDWLGEISDDDWSESPPTRAERGRAAPGYEESLVVEPGSRGGAGAAGPSPPLAATEPDHDAIARRRLVAGILLVATLGLAVVIGVLLLRGGGETTTPTTTPVETVTATTTTPTTSPTESSPSTTAPSTTTPSSTTPSTTTPSTTTPTDATAFTLPEGTKLRLGEGDPALVEELQQALTSAGYDPGPADGTFGPRTEAAVVAFQTANGLAADGVVGPETAAALSSAIAGG